MNLKQLKYVLVLSKEGNFSKAADALNITQPSLSQYIKKIEKEVYEWNDARRENREHGRQDKD